jgi:hypothetical protein
MNMQHLFPVPIGMFDLGRPLSKKEYSFILGQDTRPNQGNDTSANHFVLCDQVMTPLRGWVEDCVAEYFKATTNPKHDVNLRVTQSWFNYSKQGQFHFYLWRVLRSNKPKRQDIFPSPRLATYEVSS